MADRTAKQGASILGVGVVACAACCAPPLLAFLAAASLGTLIGVAFFGVAGLAVAVIAAVAYVRRRGRVTNTTLSVPVTFGRHGDD
jgi:hypothetical protein